ncbi:hypothetical protein SLEP1_g56820 [Rubroshorea leprosula]|uniref:Uncharacterized protein n=1 Tax=Rubroshorea leprosula TaxID=152421 RepID=A0AAV5MJV7_9ROSI|nr:hypothetical protein SLEP1_g56820 [Rubroshorea leprosula]
MEPPTMVINTVLSMMAYDYPPDKLSVYLSDDGGSDLIFYAMLEAAHFSKEWLPFCRKFKVEPRSPEAYFRMAATNPPSHDSFMTKERLMIKMGLKYGCPVEDIITGLSIQCRGWKSVYFIPERKAFLGVARTTLLQSLIQHKRWSEGDFQIFLSKYCPLVYGHKMIPLKLQLSYGPYILWAPTSLAMLYYVVVPSLCLLKGKALFPQISSPWVLPFPCVVLANRAYSLWEFLGCGGTLQGWWNEQRIWMFKRTTSYLFGFLSTILKQLGLSKATFTVTEKVVDEDVSQRYEQEVMEFGTKSPMFNIIATLAMLNLLSCIGAIKRVIVDKKALDLLALQMLLNGLLVCLNLPVYKGLFFRKDSGSMPPLVTLLSIIFAMLAATMVMY